MGEKNKRTIRGFTLMELMMTLVVVAIIAAIATPSFREFRMNGRMTTASNDLLTLLQQARSEAVKRQRIVGLCTSSDPFAAQPACGDPVVGWVLWVDDEGTVATPATDGNAGIDANEAIIAQKSIDPALRVQADGTFVSYLPNGFTRATVGADRGTRVMLLCDDRRDDRIGTDYRKRVVSLSRTGRAAVAKSVSAVQEIQAGLAAEGINVDLECAPGGGS
jgi:type IV fimbrial biogenesis protein FimT